MQKILIWSSLLFLIRTKLIRTRLNNYFKKNWGSVFSFETVFISMRLGLLSTPKPSFYMIAHDRRIAENTASDRRQLYMETLFSDRAIVSIISDYMETLFSDRIGRSSADPTLQWFQRTGDLLTNPPHPSTRPCTHALKWCWYLGNSEHNTIWCQCPSRNSGARAPSVFT